MSNKTGVHREILARTLRHYGLFVAAERVEYADQERFLAREILDLLDKLNFRRDKAEFLHTAGYDERKDSILRTLRAAGRI